jgi:hypothetical protein
VVTISTIRRIRRIILNNVEREKMYKVARRQKMLALLASW